MPFAGRKRVEGGLPILSQSVAIGRNRSRLVASRNRRQGAEKVAIDRNRSQSVAIGRASAYRSPAETEDKAPKKSRFGVPVAIGRNRSRLVVLRRFGVPVAIGRNRSRLVVLRRTGRNRSQSVAIGRASAYRSRLVVLRRTGRDWSQSVAIGRAETEDKAPKKSQSVAIGRDWSRRNKRQGAEKVAIGRNRSRLVAPKQKTRRKHKKSPIPQSGIGLHNVARRRALLAFNELLAQIHMQALEAFC